MCLRGKHITFTTVPRKKKIDDFASPTPPRVSLSVIELVTEKGKKKPHTHARTHACTHAYTHMHAHTHTDTEKVKT